MAEKTGISWTDSTFNPWWGCTEVSPGCTNCYARELAKRFGCGWGPGTPRRYFGPKHWKEPLRWNAKAAESGKRWLVFCASMADIFDNEVDDVHRWRLWNLIRETPALTWLLLTKRIGNAAKMAPDMGLLPRNVWLGASVVNQDEAERDIPKLLAVPAALHFVSYEPALGPIDWSPRLPCGTVDWLKGMIYPDAPLSLDPPYPIGPIGASIDWVIVGGESSQGGAQARPFDVQWARDTIWHCKVAGVPAFVKQLGSFAVEEREFGTAKGGCPVQLKLKDRAGADQAEWPEDLRVQEFPSC